MDLGATIVKEVVARTGIDPLKIDEVIVGNAGMPAEAANIGRVIALRAGIPEHIPAYSVQRNCASGMQAAASATINASAICSLTRCTRIAPIAWRTARSRRRPSAR